jgi:hypothetical protein
MERLRNFDPIPIRALARVPRPATPAITAAATERVRHHHREDPEARPAQGTAFRT